MSEEDPQGKAKAQEKEDKKEEPTVDAASAAVDSKIAEIRAARTELYNSRFGDGPVGLETLKPLVRHLNRLEAELTTLRGRELLLFRKELELGALRLGSNIVGTTLQIGRLVAPGEEGGAAKTGDVTPGGTVVLRKDSGARASQASVRRPARRPSVPEKKEEYTPAVHSIEMGEDLPPLLRTQSTKSLVGQNATQKWHSLMRMFREGRYMQQLNMSEELVSGAGKERISEDVREAEMTKIRTTLYSLRQRKSLSEKEEKMREKLRVRLQELRRMGADGE